MSRKSRPDKPARGGKGKKGKGGAPAARVVEEVVEPAGPPFGMVVLIAVALTIPSLMRFLDGDLEFRTTIIRFLGGLVVSWVLCQLVYSVVASFKTDAASRVDQQAPEERYPPSGPYRPPPGSPSDTDGAPHP